ncbi:SDR family NAD(P)-dependent oxidoreductase [Geodermatophilus sabuli]|uniref:NADP-dependent 3-hydroxy acid dehydrogenase YdfG n=1 Tax=Geodermatophilus sabuli TaxID=1564158 RepID=A0A285EKG0_9ACTN|nr:SDR family NAD(P)-dependent oxidoreductase [Geodermatophilus sabuli]MBB3083840.1 NAD(P)-dependent dehydrogenase (short-subunit alcohol dehydrogenase family) [Geodermatophilus sabuli]SNX98491.1 NADP-dependent 3-hydroxy acid dehydrogenase YdfG [Geodermatophilus sabuli]
MTRTVEFAGTTAVVTGGASGIGRGLARALLGAGCRVVIADVDEAALATTARELGVLGVRTDVTDPDSVAALADRAVAEYGEVHVVCNNAGVGPFGPVSRLGLDDWRWVLDVNLHGVVHGISAFLPVLERNPDWGHIVNTSSMSVLVTPPNVAPYVASKAAVLAMSEVLAAELAEAGSRVGVTVLLPGAVHSNIKASLRSRPATSGSGLYDVDLAETGRLRFIEPDEVGAMVVDAVRDDELYVLTHGEFRDQAAARAARVQAAFPAAPAPAGS